MHVICFGDSNTFGYDPRSYFGSRYAPEDRWADILAGRTGWKVSNNSLCGREIPRKDVSFPKSTDLLIILLGTNDLLQGADAHTAADRMEAFLNSISLEREKILLIAPPPMKYGEWVQDERLVKESCLLVDEYRRIAEAMDIHFMDSGLWNVSLTFDGVHFTEAGNKAFAEGLLLELRKIGLFI